METDISKKAGFFLKYGFVSLLALAFLGAGAVWYYQRTHAVLTVTEAQIAGRAVGVRTLASGTVTELLAEDGEAVKAGQVVARIRVRVSPEQITQLEQNLALTERNLNELRAGVTVSQPVYSGGASTAAVEQAAERLAKLENLYAIGAVSARERDEAAADYEAAKAAAQGSVSYERVTQAASPQAVSEAERQVRQAEAALAMARQEAAATEVTAPVGGTVYRTEVAPESEVKAGQTIVYIGDDANIWLEAYIAPERRSELRLGQYASFRVEGRELSGSIVDIEEPTEKEESSAAVHTEGSRPDDPHAGKLIVRISLPTERDFILHPGARAAVKISLR